MFVHPPEGPGHNDRSRHRGLETSARQQLRSQVDLLRGFAWDTNVSLVKRRLVQPAACGIRLETQLSQRRREQLQVGLAG